MGEGHIFNAYGSNIWVSGFLSPPLKIQTVSTVHGSLHILPLTHMFDPYALNMWPSYVKNHSTLGRLLVSFIFIEKLGLYELGPSMVQVFIDQYYSFIKTYAI